MKPTIRDLRAPLVIVVALVASLAIAACGGSSSSGSSKTKNAAATSTTKSASSSRTALAACMKQHGVTMPSRGSGGFPHHGTTTNGTPPTGTRPSGGYPGAGGGPGGGGGYPGAGGFAGGGNSKFAKAFAACRSKLGIKGFSSGGRFGNGGARTGTTPQISSTVLKTYVACIRTNGYAAMPEPNSSGKGSFFPASVEKNAKFQAANKKCVSILQKAFHRPGTGQSTTSTTSTTSGT